MTPAPFTAKVKADAAVAELLSHPVVPMAAYLAAVGDQRKARRACEIYFKPSKGSAA